MTSRSSTGRVWRSALLYYSLAAFKLVGPLALLPILANRLSPEDLGVYAVAMSLAATVAVFIEMGFSLSASRAVSFAQENCRSVFAAVSSARLIASAASFLVVLLLSQVFFGLGAAADAALGLVAWLTALGIGWGHLWYFQSQGKLVSFALVEASAITVGWVVVYLLVDGLPAALAVSCLVYLVPSLFLHLYVARRLEAPAPSVKDAKAGWLLTRSMLGYRIVASSYTSSVPLLLSLSLAPGGLAPFYVAEKLIRCLAAGLIPLIQLLYPKMCELRRADASMHRRRTLSLCGVLALGALLVSIGVFVSRETLAANFAGPALQQKVALHLGELVFMLLPLTISGVIGNLFVLACEKDGDFNRVVSTAAAVGVTLLIALPLAGLDASGASLALVGAEVVAAVGMLLLFRGRKW